MEHYRVHNNNGLLVTCINFGTMRCIPL